MLLASVLSFLSLCAAVFEDEVRSVDWKLSLFGLPVSVESNGTHLAVLGESGAFGLIDANGSTVWSRTLENDVLLNENGEYSSSLAWFKDQVVVSGEFIGVYKLDTGELVYSIDQAARCVQKVNETLFADQYAIENQKLVSVPAPPALLTRSKPCSKLISPLPLAKNEAVLSWDAKGVLNFTNTKLKTNWVREEGLATAVEGVFVHTQLLSNTDTAYLEILESLNEKNASIFTIWFTRTRFHLSQLFDVSKHLFSNVFNLLFMPPQGTKQEFMFDQVLVIRTKLGSVYGLSTINDGQVLWSHHDLEPVGIASASNNVSQFVVYTASNTTLECSWNGMCAESETSETSETSGTNGTAPNSGIRSLSIDKTTVNSKFYGWTVTLPGSAIIKIVEHSSNEVTASIASPIDENNVLYKYLNPFAVAIASLDTDRELTVSILDTVSGRVLFQAVHPDPVVINKEWPLQMVFGEHWVAYTYMSSDASHAPKLTVLDLFESSVPNQRLSKNDVIALQDTLIPYVAVRTWTLPGPNEPVYALQTSRTLFGASSRDLIICRRHRVEAIPKQWLSTIINTSAARSAREKLGDLMIVPPRGHLSHHNNVPKAELVVTGPSGLESTYLLAALGGPSVFFTMVSPSGEYDKLAKTFPKLKLLAFILVLVFTAMTFSPMVKNRVLKMQWR